MPEKMNFSKKNHTIDAFGGDFLARSGIPGCALRNGPLFSVVLRNSVQEKALWCTELTLGVKKGILRYATHFRKPSVLKTGFWGTEGKFGTRNTLLRYGVQFIQRALHGEIIQRRLPTLWQPSLT